MRSADEVDAPVARARAKQDLAPGAARAGLLRPGPRDALGALDEARDESWRWRRPTSGSTWPPGRSSRATPPPPAASSARPIRVFRARGADGRQRSTSLLRAAVDVGDGRVPRGVDTLASFPGSAHGPRPSPSERRLAARIHVETLLLRGDVGSGAAYAAKPLGARRAKALRAPCTTVCCFAKVAAAQGDSRARAARCHASARRLGRRQAPSQSLEVRSALALHGRRLS